MLCAMLSSKWRIMSSVNECSELNLFYEDLMPAVHAVPIRKKRFRAVYIATLPKTILSFVSNSKVFKSLYIFHTILLYFQLFNKT